MNGSRKKRVDQNRLKFPANGDNRAYKSPRWEFEIRVSAESTLSPAHNFVGRRIKGELTRRPRATARDEVRPLFPVDLF